MGIGEHVSPLLGHLALGSRGVKMVSGEDE
jgi:hypothetical protein